jgi:hypothetical protein
MNNRETKKIKTPSGKEVELKIYLTARERNELRNIYLNEMKIEAKGETPVIKEIPGSIVEKTERKVIELTVVSYDGSKDNILERILDSLPEDYDFIVNEANKVGSGNFQKAK